MTIESLLKHPYDVLAVGAEDSGTALRRCDYGIFKQLAGSTKDDFFADKGEGAQVGRPIGGGWWGQNPPPGKLSR
jgi:hypothetical protein